MKKYILALDEGTTSTRAILFDREGRIVSKSQKEFMQRYPAVGWVEHDASEIYASQYAVMTEAVISAGVSPEEIGAIRDSGNRTAAGPTVPPGGLYMTHLWYDDGNEKFEVANPITF